MIFFCWLGVSSMCIEPFEFALINILPVSFVEKKPAVIMWRCDSHLHFQVTVTFFSATWLSQHIRN